MAADEGQKAWPQPEGLTTAEVCALIITRLWLAVRGKAAGPQSRKVWNACDAMWEASGQEPLGMDGSHWRRRLELARSMLDGADASGGTKPNSPEGKLRQLAMRRVDELAASLSSYAEEGARRKRRAAVAERVAQLRRGQ